MSCKTFTRGVVVALTLAVVLGTVGASPVAADDHDDGGLLGDDGEDGLLGDGGDDGLLGTDGENATAGGDDGVGAGTGGVSVGDSEVGGDDAPVGADGGPVDGDVGEVTGAVPNATGDGAPTDGLPDRNATDGIDGIDDLLGAGGAIDTRNGTVDPGRLPVGDGPVPDAGAPLDVLERSAGTDDLPADGAPVDVPATGEDAPFEPEDLPYGSGGSGLFAACRLPASAEDLPTEAAPAYGDLPVEPAVPGVPVNLVTPDVVGRLVLGLPPRPCTVYDAHDPSVDPTEPPTSPDAGATNHIVDASSDGATYLGESSGSLADDGAAYRTVGGSKVDDDSASNQQQLQVTDGRTPNYLVVQYATLAEFTAPRGEGWVRVALFGKFASAELACDGTEPTNVTLDEPTKHCEDRVGGVPTPPSGPADVIDTVRNPPEPENPIDPDGLPDELDELVERLGDAS